MCWGFDPSIVGTVAAWVVTPICVALGAWAAHCYQVRSKMIEFQFNALREASLLQRKLILHSFCCALSRQRASELKSKDGSSLEGPDRDAVVRNVENSERDLSNLLGEARDLETNLHLLFTQETLAHWDKMHEHYSQVGTEKDYKKNGSEWVLAEKEWRQFVIAVRRAIGIPLIAPSAEKSMSDFQREHPWLSGSHLGGSQ